MGAVFSTLLTAWI